MAGLPPPPEGLTLIEWRRAVALIAATETMDGININSPMLREQNVINSAKRFESYLMEGR